MRKFFTLLRKQKPLPGLGPTGALEAGGWQEASGCTRCRAKDPRQNSSINCGFLQACCLGNYLTFLIAGIFSIAVSASSFGGSLTLMGVGGPSSAAPSFSLTFQSAADISSGSAGPYDLGNMTVGSGNTRVIAVIAWVSMAVQRGQRGHWIQRCIRLPAKGLLGKRFCASPAPAEMTAYPTLTVGLSQWR
jgi:hypothetical protein